jgi:anti-anti-sigma regulatory factor
MALNFKINRKRKNGHLYFKLTGDFDGSSAMELIRSLERNASNAEQIFIDTCGLSSVQDFGQDLFVKQCAISKILSRKLIFSGSYSDRITLNGACFQTTEKVHQAH